MPSRPPLETISDVAYRIRVPTSSSSRPSWIPKMQRLVIETVGNHNTWEWDQKVTLSASIHCGAARIYNIIIDTTDHTDPGALIGPDEWKIPSW